MSTDRLTYLFEQYETGKITASEKEELYAFVSEYENKEDILDFLVTSIRETAEENNQEINRWQPTLEKIIHSKPPITLAKVRKMITWRPWKKIAVAASIILAIGTYLVIARSKATKQSHEIVKNQDIEAPKSTKATITLADGKTISIDSLNNLAQGEVTLTKTADDKIIYEESSLTTHDSPLSYNTLNNPRGSKVIDITLSDGSHVWLNAGSSLRYPASFASSRLNRSVEITGEAYFEVSHDANKPFFVSKGEMQVQVLGTHFNVNAYDDETDIKVTLLEGSVQVSASFAKNLAPSAVKIKPGEQAQITNEIKVVKGVDLNTIMAWQHGLFEFNNAELPVIMRQIARWYDVDIIYEGTLTHTKFGGGISNNLPLSNVLKLLEANGVSFRLEGKKLFVKP